MDNGRCECGRPLIFDGDAWYCRICDAGRESSLARPHDGLDWGGGPLAGRPPTVAELRAWLADKPDTAVLHARDDRIWVANFGKIR
jgi:hypothetical protein